MGFKEVVESVGPRIAQRGRRYFSNGAVYELKAVSEHCFAAKVRGTDFYDVEICLGQNDFNRVERVHCSCPYDYGVICKHIVAVLLEMSEREDELEDMAKQAETANARQKDHLQQIYEQVSKDDLWKFITSNFSSVDGLEPQFRAYFADLLDEDPSERYRIMVDNYVERAEGPFGMFDYQAVPTLTEPLYKLLDKAGRLADEGDFRQCTAICKVLIEKGTELYEYIDDSNGMMADVVERAFDMLDEMATRAPVVLRDTLFDWATEEFHNSKYHDFGFESHFLYLLPGLITTEDQGKRFLRLLDRQIEIEGQKKYGRYSISRLLVTKIKFLEQRGEDQQVRQLLEDNKQYADIRHLLINEKLEEGDFNAAKELCKEGIREAQESHLTGLINTWYRRLYEIAREEENLADQRKWAERLFLDSKQPLQWYRTLKSTYSQEEWEQRRDELIDSYKNNNKRGGYVQAGILADIFVEEGLTERLFKLVNQNNMVLNFVDQYADELSDSYAEDMLQMYEDGIKVRIQNTGRKVYREIAHWLDRMQGIRGGDERAYALMEKMLRQYNNRPAMKDEFRKAFPEWF